MRCFLKPVCVNNEWRSDDLSFYNTIMNMDVKQLHINGVQRNYFVYGLLFDGGTYWVFMNQESDETPIKIMYTNAMSLIDPSMYHSFSYVSIKKQPCTNTNGHLVKN